MDSDKKFKNVHQGRVPDADVKKFKDMYANGKRVQDIAEATGWSGVTVRNHVFEGQPKRKYKRQYVNNITGERYHTRETELVTNLRDEVDLHKDKVKEVDKKMKITKEKLDRVERENIDYKTENKNMKKNLDKYRAEIEKLREKNNDMEREHDLFMMKIKTEGYLTKGAVNKANNNFLKYMQDDGVLNLYMGLNKDNTQVFRSLSEYMK